MSEPLIALAGIKKVFYTDEVETHALSDIHLEIRKGEYLAIAGPSGCGKTTLLSILGPARLAHRGQLHARRAAGLAAHGVRARAGPEPADRVHLPGLQPDRRPHGVRERRAAAHLPRHARRGAPEAGAGGARAGRDVAPDEAFPGPALGRPAAARRGGARGGRRPGHPPRRRADRQPRLDQRRGGHGAAPRAAPGRRDHLHGDARRALRRATPSARSTSSTARWSRSASSPP